MGRVAHHCCSDSRWSGRSSFAVCRAEARAEKEGESSTFGVVVASLDNTNRQQCHPHGRAFRCAPYPLVMATLGHPESYQLNPGSSETGASMVQSKRSRSPYPLLMNQRFTGINAPHRSESRFRSSAGWRRSSASGATCFNVGGQPGPNTPEAPVVKRAGPS